MKILLSPIEYDLYCAEYNAWLDDQEHSEQILDLQAVLRSQPDRIHTDTDWISLEISQLDK